MWGSLGTVQQSNSRGFSPARDKENCLIFVFHKASSEWTHCGVCTLLSHSNTPHACMHTNACQCCNPQEFWELFGHQYYCCCCCVFNVRENDKIFYFDKISWQLSEGCDFFFFFKVILWRVLPGLGFNPTLLQSTAELKFWICGLSSKLVMVTLEHQHSASSPSYGSSLGTNEVRDVSEYPSVERVESKHARHVCLPLQHVSILFP